MTLATIIRDVYRAEERIELWEALKWLAPAPGWGWHPAGLYSFWDPDTGEILYIGLATSLERRFAQHNALRVRSARGNKRVEIDEWFTDHSRLGYSIIVQSTAVELLGHFGLDTPAEIVAIGEGQLLEAHRQKFGHLPPWNQMGGSVYGATWAGPRSPGYFGLLSGQIDSLLVARRTIRQLASEPTSSGLEKTLHGARLHALHEHGMGEGVSDIEILHALEQLRTNPRLGDDPLHHQVMIDTGYWLLEAAHPERPVE